MTTLLYAPLRTRPLLRARTYVPLSRAQVPSRLAMPSLCRSHPSPLYLPCTPSLPYVPPIAMRSPFTVCALIAMYVHCALPSLPHAPSLLYMPQFPYVHQFSFTPHFPCVTPSAARAPLCRTRFPFAPFSLMHTLIHCASQV
jgi:hypothetical protein